MKTLKIILFTMIIAITAISCDNYLDVNTDPNNPVTVSNDLILPVAQRYTAELLYGTRPTRRLNTLGNMFMQNWSNAAGYSWYNSEMDYALSSTFYNSIWNHSYSNALKQYHVLDQDIENNEYYQAIGKIMKSYHFEILVDAYGDIPYFEALQRGENTTPQFDSAEVVYDDLIIEINNAIALIKSGSTNLDVNLVGSDDKLYNGNMNSWIKFANTLKLRILARQSSLATKQSYISDELDVINNEGSGYITSDSGVNLGYVKEVDKQNPFWNFYGEAANGDILNNFKATCATPYVINKLQGFNDNRIDFIYEKPDSGHRGVLQGVYPIPADATDDNVSNIGPGLLKSPEQDAIILTLAEANFLQAELALLFPGKLGDAKASYEAGVIASFNYLGAPDGAAYISQPIENVGWNFSTNKLEAIMTQKWIALNGINAGQSWFDYTRTGYPSDMPISGSATGPNIPVRLFYSSSEISGNASNVPSPQPDGFSNKIFWAN